MIAIPDVEGWLARRYHRPEAGPAWLTPVARRAATVDAAALSRNDPPATTPGERQAAVLVLLGDDAGAGPDVLLQQRAATLRHHAGEVSFPGGGREAEDAGPVETALREAAEETGLDPGGVAPLACLPRLFIPPSGFQVTAVLAHWRAPVEVAPVDRAETRSVFRVPLRDLADPANRLAVHNGRGWHGPAFTVAGVVVWGYTAEILAALLGWGGWARPWAAEHEVTLEHAWELIGTGRRNGPGACT